MRTLSAILLVLLSAHLSAPAATLTLDFDTLDDGTALSSQFPGVTFANAVVLTAGLSLNEFDFPPASGPNVIADVGGPITIWFSRPVVEFGGAFTYIEPVTIAAYGVGDLLLDTAISTWSVNTALGGVPGSAPNEQLRVAAPGIVRVYITGNDLGASFTADNLFAAEVPEPGTGLLLCGALLCCLCSRKILGKVVPLLILCLPISSVAATIGPANVSPYSRSKRNYG